MIFRCVNTIEASSSVMKNNNQNGFVGLWTKIHFANYCDHFFFTRTRFFRGIFARCCCCCSRLIWIFKSASTVVTIVSAWYETKSAETTDNVRYVNDLTVIFVFSRFRILQPVVPNLRVIWPDTSVRTRMRTFDFTSTREVEGFVCNNGNGIGNLQATLARRLAKLTSPNCRVCVCVCVCCEN